MTTKDADQLVILGNGFDLNCGLKTSFRDYFAFKKKEILRKLVGVEKNADGKKLDDLKDEEIELLKRKMSKDIKSYDYNTLLALSSLYGIELLSDNLRCLQLDMNAVFKNMYRKDVDSYNKKINKNVLKSAQVIIEANMVQGDTLKRKKNDGFSNNT